MTRNNFPLTESKFPVIGDKFPVTRRIFLVRENSFLMNFGRLLGVSHFCDKCVGFTIKISCETLGFLGSLVPRDCPTLLPVEKGEGHQGVS